MLLLLLLLFMVFYEQETCAVVLDQLELLNVNFGYIGNGYYALHKLLFTTKETIRD